MATTLAQGQRLGADLPRGSFTCQAGVCRGNDDSTTGIFAGLQRAINVFAQLLGSPALRVTVDGLIGPRTLSSAATILASFGNVAIPQDTPTLAQMAKDIAELIAARANVAPNFSMPSRTPAPPPSTAIVPATPQPLPQPLPPEGDNGVKKGIHWGWWALGALALAGAGYLGYRIFFKGSDRKRAFAGGDDDYGEAADDFIDV